MEEKNSDYQKKNSLYSLLPAIYRQHEFDQPGSKRPKPLQELLGIIGEQAAQIESDISQLYDNWFIETCQEWVVPYIADLLGVKGIRPASKATFSQRSWIANTISHRRSKGTLAMVEQLAHDVTDWNAMAVEFFQYLSSTQNMNHGRPGNAAFNMRSMDALDVVGTPFDTLARTADVRHIATRRGRHNIHNIGIFLWRLQSYHVNDSPAYGHGSGRFSFSQLGNDIQLFNHPVTEQSVTHITQEVNVPGPIRRRALHENPLVYCGRGKSINIVKDGVQVDAANIVSCDLAEWKNVPKKGKVAVDPFLGRMLFPVSERPQEVRVSYYYGFSADIGGGSYLQRDSKAEGIDVYEIAKKSEITSISQAIAKWKKKPTSAIFEIADSDVYDESIDDIELPADTSLTIRAGEGKRPTITLAKTLVLSSDATVAKSGMTFEGLLIHSPKGKSVISIKGRGISFLNINHCTLVPESEPGTAKSIELDGVSDEMTLRLYRTICGRISSQNTRAALEVKDSIIDGKDHDKPTISFYRTRIESSTIFGATNVTIMDLASDTIFSEPAIAERVQMGCVRFSYVPPGSRLGRRFRCQPVAELGTKSQARPYFVSERYGDAGYAQLHANSDKEIAEGGHDGNEMGAFNHLLQRHRLANLESCLEEYTRFGMEAGVFLVT